MTTTVQYTTDQNNIYCIPTSPLFTFFRHTVFILILYLTNTYLPLTFHWNVYKLHYYTDSLYRLHTEYIYCLQSSIQTASSFSLLYICPSMGRCIEKQTFTNLQTIYAGRWKIAIWKHKHWSIEIISGHNTTRRHRPVHATKRPVFYVAIPAYDTSQLSGSRPSANLHRQCSFWQLPLSYWEKKRKWHLWSSPSTV